MSADGQDKHIRDGVSLKLYYILLFCLHYSEYNCIQCAEKDLTQYHPHLIKKHVYHQRTVMDFQCETFLNLHAL